MALMWTVEVEKLSPVVELIHSIPTTKLSPKKHICIVLRNDHGSIYKK